MWVMPAGGDEFYDSLTIDVAATPIAWIGG